MTTLRKYSNHVVAAATAFALSLAMFGTTVTTPSAHNAVHTVSVVA